MVGPGDIIFCQQKPINPMTIMTQSHFIILFGIPFVLLNMRTSWSVFRLVRQEGDHGRPSHDEMNSPKAKYIPSLIDAGSPPASSSTAAANTTESDVAPLQPANTTHARKQPRFDLRMDWSNLGIRTPLAQRIERMQNDCHVESNPTNATEKMKFFIKRGDPGGGIGSNLNEWSSFACIAMRRDAMVLFRGDFTWAKGLPQCEDQRQKAHASGLGYSYLNCFFPKESTTKCAPPDKLPGEDDDKKDARILQIRPRAEKRSCERWLEDTQNTSIQEFHGATFEWLFSQVSDFVIEEARRQIQEAFGDEGLPDPEDLVTLHIRWGDKSYSMKLKPISSYIHAVHKMVGPRANQTDRPLHVYVASEDKLAIAAFEKEKPSHWIMHQSGPSFRGSVHMPSTASGITGLQSLGALLVSMEANYYVLTTISFWSRLIDGLRTNVVDQRCNSCTKVHHLQKPDNEKKRKKKKS